MKLSRSTWKEIEPDLGNELWSRLNSLPEKVIQFGTGVLLRGLPDYYIDRANRQGIFNGRILVVKSTSTGGADAFDHQDGLYTQVLRGLENGEIREKIVINSSISRVLSAATHWPDILICATNPDIQVVISNTTEVGICLTEDDIFASPPVSFPGKLLSILYTRYLHFNGDPEKGLVVVPTELIPDNGARLASIISELARRHGLGPGFYDWLEKANIFCNSLVDRIVPGRLKDEEYREMCRKTGYEDDLLIVSETYGLWAIEARQERVREVLSFAAVDKGVVIVPDIRLHRELKLRLLNGSHTFSCGLAFLCGFHTVYEAMQDKAFSRFINGLMKEEIVPAITGNELTTGMALDFADQVLDRYRNPFIEHPWINITVQYTGKMATRNIPILLAYLERTRQVPRAMALGFAAYLLFMKGKEEGKSGFMGQYNQAAYPIKDDKAADFSSAWLTFEPELLVKKILGQTDWWGTDLNQYPEWSQTVGQLLARLLKDGPGKILLEHLTENSPA